MTSHHSSHLLTWEAYVHSKTVGQAVEFSSMYDIHRSYRMAEETATDRAGYPKRCHVAEAEAEATS